VVDIQYSEFTEEISVESSDPYPLRHWPTEISVSETLQAQNRHKELSTSELLKINPCRVIDSFEKLMEALVLLPRNINTQNLTDDFGGYRPS
jgi:hypothetical protein